VTRTFWKFLTVGTFFATVEEFLTVVLLRHDWKAYLFTLLLLFPAFLTMVWASSRMVERFFQREPARELAHFIIYGAVGLVIEWFVIGLSPWSNPQANPMLMALFQLGMFSFWGTVAFAPRLFTRPQKSNQDVRRAIVAFYVPYFAAVYGVAWFLPAERRFGIVILLIIFGYLSLNVFYLKHFLRAFSERA